MVGSRFWGTPRPSWAIPTRFVEMWESGAHREGLFYLYQVVAVQLILTLSGWLWV